MQPTRAQAPAKIFVTADGKRPSGLFAPGVMVGKTLYIAGKGDYKPKEETGGKVKNCLGEIRKVLKMAGMDMNNVVQTYIYLEDHDQYAEVNKHYASFFPAIRRRVRRWESPRFPAIRAWRSLASRTATSPKRNGSAILRPI